MNVEYSNKWINIISDGEGDEKYFYVNEPLKICILPYIQEDDELLIVSLIEPISIWDEDRSREITCVQGTIEDGDDPIETAPRELYEETGFNAPLPEFKDRYTYVGKYNFSKSSDSHRYLFLVDVTGMERGKKTTDGSDFEKRTKIMVSKPTILEESTDMTLQFLYHCLKQKLEQ